MPITPLPDPPLRSDSAEVFVEKADTFMAALPAFAVEANALEGTLQIVATTGTSTTSLLIGTGSKSLTTQTGKAWVVGSWVYIVNTANVANYMTGQITAYTSGTGALVVNVTQTAGSGTLAAWTIGIAVPSTTAVTATTATNIAGGSAGTLPYQTGAGATAQTAAGTTAQVLRGGTTPAFVAPFIAGGTAGSVPYQTGANATGVTAAGTSTQVLSGGATPAFVAPFIAGGTAGSVPYQTGPSATGLTAVGAAGQFLQSTGAGAPVFASPPSVTGAFKNLKLSTTGTSAPVTVTADEIVVSDGAGYYKTLSAVSLSVAGTSVGVANGLDAGSLVTSQWYSAWVIWNGATTSGLLSLSATAPTLPAGYTHKARVGWIKTDGTANKYPLSFLQLGRRAYYVVASGSNVTAIPNMASAVTASFWTSVSVDAFVPPGVSHVNTGINCNNVAVGGSVAATTNNSYANTAPFDAPLWFGNGNSAGIGFSESKDLPLESRNIYWGSSTGTGTSAFLKCYGWEDNL